MKRLYFLFFIACAGLASLHAQAYLVNTLQPTEKNRLSVSSTKTASEWGEDMLLKMSYIFRSNGGFLLEGDAHGLIGGDNHGYVTYQLNGQYDKISFWLAPGFTTQGVAPLDKTILTVRGDNKLLYDKPVFHADPPRFITLNVKGVKELKFKLLIGEIDLSFAKVQLWKEGVEVVQPSLYPSLPAGKVQLVEQLVPYFTTRYVNPITQQKKVRGLEYAS
ncbi:MAG: hypothetical protein IJ814_08400 [Paludibacteraceae bacterium]|nr:hypothetical protein [Paludibacteraceae bacterium]